jgi:3-oxoacyl-[acyl-carrier-protein] synthase II
MTRRRVVITGLGIISPIGIGIEANWANITAGVGGIGPITRFNTEGMGCTIAGQADDFDLTKWISPKEARKMDRFMQLGMAAGMDAFKDCGIEVTEANAHRIGVYIGSGIGGVQTIEDTTTTLHEKGPRRVSPFYVPMSIINMISGHISIQHGLKGPNLSMVTACTTGTHAIGEAARLIEYGDADMMIAGGAEAAITPTAISGFANARALSSRNDDPEHASRPWDTGRDGFVMGEGSGVVALEELEHAKKRGVHIYAEVVGFGMSADAHHMTQPAPGGEGAALCMRNCLSNAGLNPQDVDYINAHGTSTQLGDLAETEAIKLALGAHARKVAVSSTKSMVGHLLGAAGGVEAVYTALALDRGVIPPTINLHDQDPRCDLDYVPNTARDAKPRIALSNSFGFGGTNGTIALARYS